jgi:DNA repair protein RadC
LRSAFHCDPSAGFTATLQDHQNILGEPVVVFKGTIDEKFVYGRTILLKACNIQVLDLL